MKIQRKFLIGLATTIMFSGTTQELRSFFRMY
jgi:hypothetical protein